MELVFRILDRDHLRAARAETDLLGAMKAHGLEGRVYSVYETLEFSRLGVTELPALELGGVVLIQGRELEPDRLDNLCRRMAEARREMDRRRSGAGSNTLEEGLA